MIKTIIIDDEPLGRERIRSFIDEEPEVEIVDECINGKEAIACILNLKPDLIFLDVQMPEFDGFEVLQEIAPDHLPVIIFVTAYDKYALRAFEVNALDYLLKPFDRERFNIALHRAKEYLNKNSTGNFNDRVIHLLEDIKTKQIESTHSGYLEKLVIKSMGRIYFIRVDEIEWIEAAANYVRLHIGKESHLLRQTMNKLELNLNPKNFSRIHRSTIVNIDHVQEIQPWFNGESKIILQNGTKLISSRGFRNIVQKFFKQG